MADGLTEFAVLSLGFACGISLVSYRSMAQANGWIIGSWLRAEASVPAMLGFVVCVLTVGRGLFSVEPVWLAFAAIPAGFVIGFGLTLLLRNWAPVIFAPLAVVLLLVQVWMLT